MKINLLLLPLLFPVLIKAQVIEKPNFAYASHPMTVEKIELTGTQTIITLSIENQSETGSFCADKNIYLQDVIKNTKYKLTQSKNIPVCPDKYEFISIGEVLKFQLYFPKIATGTKYLTIVEDCQEYCFRIKGIILDEALNKEIDLAYEHYKTGKPDFALIAFKQTVNTHAEFPSGLLHFNIIQILAEKNDMVDAKKWYKQLLNSKFIDKNEITERLKQQYYYSKLTF